MRVAFAACVMVALGVLCVHLGGCSNASAEPVGPRAEWRAPGAAASGPAPMPVAGDNGDGMAAAFEAMGDLSSAPAGPPAPAEATEGRMDGGAPAPAEEPQPMAEPNPADDPDGSLDQADLAADDGRYYDAVALRLEPAGEGAELRLRAAVVATTFVPCVGVVTADNPSGVWALPQGDVACAWIDVSGENLAECTVVVTSGHPGRAGRYYLALAEGDGDFPAEAWAEHSQIGIDDGRPEGEPAAPDWSAIELPDGYGANWDTGIGPEQVAVFGIRPFSRDGRYMSLTGNIRFLHHGRTDVWLPRDQIDALLWLPRLSLAVVESVTKRPPPPAPEPAPDVPEAEATDAEPTDVGPADGDA